MSRKWTYTMNKSLEVIHNDMTASLRLIKTDLESKGLQFDEKFRNLFCRSISNRLNEIYDIFEMEQADSKSGRTRKRKRPTSNESTSSKRRKCDENLPKWAFTCAHCYSENSQNDWFGSVEKVQKHWKGIHAKINLPFHFYVDHTVQCYRCQFEGFSEKVQQHARTGHKEFSVFIKSKRESRDRECAFCIHRECNGNIPDHFRRIHLDEINSMGALNLIPFSYRDLVDLNAIGENDLRCSYCKRSYATIIDFDQHHRVKHPGLRKKYDEVKSICCLCETSIRSTKFLVHVKQCGLFKCDKCRNFQAKTAETFLVHIKEMHSNKLSNGFFTGLRRSLMDKYLSMRCIFQNGLVLTKRNLVSSRFDDRKEFMNLIADSVNQLKMLAKSYGLREG